MALLRKILLCVASLACLLAMAIIPVNKHEWMRAEDPAVALPLDGNAGIYPWIAILPVAVFFAVTLFLKDTRDRRVSFLVQGALALFWVYKFFV